MFIIVSCTSRTIYKKPEDLIAKEKMISLWTDIYIANSASGVKNKKLQTKINYMPLVLEKYNIDSARFMRSNVYYTSKVEDYEKMFKQVEKNLKNLRDLHDPEMAGIDPSLPIYVKDSIRRSRKEQKNKEKRKELELQQKLEEKSRIKKE